MRSPEGQENSPTPSESVGVTAGVGLVDAASAAFGRYVQGDPSGMDDLVRTMTPLLWRVARACGLDAQAAEDAVQATWLALVRSADTLTEKQAVLAWLLTTCRRESWRARARATRTTPMQTPREDASPVGGISTPPPDPQQSVLATEESQRLWRHVSELSPRCQYLLKVVCSGERPDYAAIGEALGMPVGSIGPTRGRCLAALRQRLLADPGWSAT